MSRLTRGINKNSDRTDAILLISDYHLLSLANKDGLKLQDSGFQD